MRNREEVKALLEYVESSAGRLLKWDEEAIHAAYLNHHDQQSLPIKILSVFGGVLASLAFLGFLLIAGLYESDTGLLLFGLLFVAGSLWINKAYDRIILDTASVSFFIMGLALIGIGLGQLDVNEDLISVVFIVIALISLVLVQNFILSFISVLIMNGSTWALFISNDADILIYFHLPLLAITLVFFFLREAKILTLGKIFCKLYHPVRLGLIISFLTGLVLVGTHVLLKLSIDYRWMPSVVFISCILYLIHVLLNQLSVSESKYRIYFYLFALVILVPTVLAPSISGVILIILLSYYVNYKTGLVLGVISFVYFISQYYYDLHFTLLTKSILLFCSGLLLLLLYGLTTKKADIQ